MIKVAMLTVLASFCMIANADPMGQWKGKAVYKDSTGQTQNIPELIINVAKTGDQLTVTDPDSWTLMPGAVTLKGTDLYFKDAKVGSITANTVDIKDVPVDGGVLYSLSLAIQSDGTALFKDMASYTEEEGLTDGVEGTLTKATE